jgi:hypothetical protein
MIHQLINKIIKYQLRSLSGAHNLDKDEAISMLLLLGLKHYSLIYSLDANNGLDIKLLRQLAAKYVNDLQFSHIKPSFNGFDDIIRQENCYNEESKTNINNNNEEKLEKNHDNHKQQRKGSKNISSKNITNKRKLQLNIN